MSTHLIIPIENSRAYHSIPRNQQLGLRIDHRCNQPSKTLVVDWKGDCFVCSCEAWLPITVGKIQEFDSLNQIWASATAQHLQRDIDLGHYTHCAVDRCGILQHNIQQESYTISINIDESCNLRCPSCRTDLIMNRQGPDYLSKLAQVNHLVGLLESFDQPCHIVMSGNGDPLASSIMRPLIQRFRPGADQTIRLFTNGLLLKKQLSHSSILNHITQYFISIDAGSPGVYEQVRRPGRWTTLLDNLDWLQTVQLKTGAEVLLKFVLQQDNWHDMHNFADLCQQYGFNGVINRLEDWGTWSEFAQHDVIGNSQHPDHAAARAALKSVFDRASASLQFNASLAQLAKETV